MLREWLSHLTEFAIQVQGRSMEPSVLQGEHLQAIRAGMTESLVRGDVVVFHSPGDRRRLEFKRIIGLPGEEIVWVSGRICVNGEPLQEPYARLADAPPGDDEASWCRLGSDEFFVAGDNRLHSRDSRVYGPVKRKAILAKIPQ